jgi:hypothetical protein
MTKSIKFFLPVTCLLLSAVAFAQPTPGYERTGFFSKLKINAGAGISNYYGDLTENAHWFNQSSFAVSLGLHYPIINHINARFDVSYLKVQGDDAKNTKSMYTERNLNFRSFIWDASLAVEFDAVNFFKNRFGPYAFVGFGAFYFNPYSRDANGYKQFLQPLGTEGQGLDAYPDRKMYNRLQTMVPFGGGLKWKCKKVMLALEFKYRKLHTDYLDDVSTDKYPDKALLDARNPRTAMFTWRSPSGLPYPSSTSKLPRGNPKKNDTYYTTEIKVAFQL